MGLFLPPRIRYERPPRDAREEIWGLKRRKTYKGRVSAYKKAGYLASELIKGRLWVFYPPPNTFGETEAKIVWSGKKWPAKSDMALSFIYWHLDGRVGTWITEQEAQKRLKVASSMQRQRHRIAEEQEKDRRKRWTASELRRRGPLHPSIGAVILNGEPLERGYDRLVSSVWAGVETVELPSPYLRKQVYMREQLC